MSWEKDGVNSEFIRQANQVVQPCLAAPWSHLALLGPVGGVFQWRRSTEMLAGNRTGDPGRARRPSEFITSRRAASSVRTSCQLPYSFSLELPAQEKEEQRAAIGRRASALPQMCRGLPPPFRAVSRPDHIPVLPELIVQTG